MHLKVIQVNIYKGRYLGNLVSFLKEQYPDIIFMEEVSSGAVNLSGDNANIFEYLKKELGYEGVFYASATIVDRPDTFQGNAVFSRHKIVESTFLPLNRHAGITLDTFNNPEFSSDFPRSLVEAKIDIEGRTMMAIAGHGAWTAPPQDTEENLRQAKIIANHLKQLELPFLMGADMNMPPGTRVIKTIEKSAENWVADSGIMQTTHPTVHKIAPKGYVVDYIFASKEFKRVSIEAPEVLVSDHLPLVAELEFV